MISRQSQSGLPPETRERLTEIQAKNCIADDDLDFLLASLTPEHFEDQLEQLIAGIGKVPMKPAPITRKDEHVSLPSGGKISRRYLKDIQSYATMTKAEEQSFARRMEFASARIDAAEFEESSIRLARRAEYSRIRAVFVERNLHLVVSEAYAYRTYGVPLDDLIQEGNTALMRAVEKFDWRHGVRFRTYVSYWIRQAIERYLAAQKGAVRVPHHLQQKFRRLKREGKLPRGADQDLTVDQLADAFDVSRDLAGHLLESTRPSFSLDQTVSKEGDSYRDFLTFDWEPLDRDREHGLQHRLRDLMTQLDERERTVLRMRFGLDGTGTATLEEVGRALELSRERSRQIQQKALSKLLKSARSSHLDDYL